MKCKAVVFTAANVVEFQDREIATDPIPAGKFLIKTIASVVSQGTELAILRGSEAWAKLPYYPGSGCVGTVVGVGEGVQDPKVGDLVYTIHSHNSYVLVDPTYYYIKLPSDMDPQLAALARPASIAFGAVRQSHVELGDYVAVQGLGLIGNFAAQAMRESGATVIGVDVSKKRLNMAVEAGIPHVIHAAEEDPIERIKEITHGRMCQTTVEATGVPDLITTACKMAGKWGETILLGSPRGKFKGDATELLDMVHSAPNGVTLKGAHEWLYPIWDRDDGQSKHSIERNARIFMDFVKQGRIYAKELITHAVNPKDCKRVYKDLVDRNDDYLGVIHDWTKL